MLTVTFGLRKILSMSGAGSANVTSSFAAHVRNDTIVTGEVKFIKYHLGVTRTMLMVNCNGTVYEYVHPFLSSICAGHISDQNSCISGAAEVTTLTPSVPLLINNSRNSSSSNPVSYTHLTLPTIYSV